MNNLVFSKVETEEQFSQWREFAASFEHDIPNAILPIVNVSRRENDGKLRQFGYYTLLNQSVVLPCYHPKHCSPRDFHDMTAAFSNTQCLSSISPQFPNGCSVVGLVTNGLPVGRNLVAKLGYENLGIELHRRIP